jgi:hypothetical protein
LSWPFAKLVRRGNLAKLRPEYMNTSFFISSRFWKAIFVLQFVLISHAVFASDNVVIQWNEAILQSIRDIHPPPTVAARAIAIVHTCMFDAWAAYDEKARATVLGKRLRRPAVERTDANRGKAISIAAYACATDLFPSQRSQYQELLISLGFHASRSKDPANAEGIGNLAASAILRRRHHDGSNQLGDLHPGAYTDYTGYRPVNDPDHVYNLDRWQPLRVPDGHGAYVIQRFTTPHWGKVNPFALGSGSRYRPERPVSIVVQRAEYEEQAHELLDISSNLTVEQRMIAEYWANGPDSELPPGLWCLLAQFVSLRDHHTVTEDVKMFFLLGNALLDASIAAWDAKRAYDSVRPITAIRFLTAGQKVRAWAGLGLGMQVLDGAEWQPYQPAVVVTPPFPEYVSGHSTFSAAAAEVLKRFTGSDAFGYSVSLEPGSSNVEPGTFPSNSVTLAWSTFTEAADQAGMSRRYCGIHFKTADLAGLALGRKVAQDVWDKGMFYIEGEKIR